MSLTVGIARSLGSGCLPQGLVLREIIPARCQSPAGSCALRLTERAARFGAPRLPLRAAGYKQVAALRKTLSRWRAVVL